MFGVDQMTGGHPAKPPIRAKHINPIVHQIYFTAPELKNLQLGNQNKMSTGSPQRARQARCPPGSKQPVPHPTKCAQYYDCGATFTWWQQRDVQLRECPAPLVFSPVVHTCVFPAPGVCGDREEPLDACE